MKLPSLALLVGLLTLAGCGAEVDAPVIFGLEDGTVTTEEQELVPLAHFREAGYTQVLLVPAGVANPDPAGLPLEAESRKRAVAAATYAQGIAPELIIAPATRVGNFMSNNVRMGGQAALRPYDEGSAPAAIAAILTGEGAGKRVVVIGEVAELEAVVAAAYPAADFEWPAEGAYGLAYVAAGGADGAEVAVQPFAIVTDWSDQE